MSRWNPASGRRIRSTRRWARGRARTGSTPASLGDGRSAGGRSKNSRPPPTLKAELRLQPQEAALLVVVRRRAVSIQAVRDRVRRRQLEPVLNVPLDAGLVLVNDGAASVGVGLERAVKVLG